MSEKDYDQIMGTLMFLLRTNNCSKIAKETRISRMTIQDIVSGRTNPKLKTIVDILGTLGFTLEIVKKK